MVGAEPLVVGWGMWCGSALVWPVPGRDLLIGHLGRLASLEPIGQGAGLLRIQQEELCRQVGNIQVSP